MPGKTFKGHLPSLTAQQADLSARLREHVQMLGGDIGERNVYKPEKLEYAAKYIEHVFARLGYETGKQEYEAEHVTVRNIDVNVPGTTHPDEIVVVGAHYDSVMGAPGANDNASGVAATLEIARMLHDKKLSRTIRYVAFVNEEPPFFQSDKMGSVVYAKRCKERGEKIVAMLTPETIGYYSDEPEARSTPRSSAGSTPRSGTSSRSSARAIRARSSPSASGCSGSTHNSPAKAEQRRSRSKASAGRTTGPSAAAGIPR
jgi:Zn-dependent M28 family amino/carboxypeptidase